MYFNLIDFQMLKQVLLVLFFKLKIYLRWNLNLYQIKMVKVVMFLLVQEFKSVMLLLKKVIQMNLFEVIKLKY